MQYLWSVKNKNIYEVSDCRNIFRNINMYVRSARHWGRHSFSTKKSILSWRDWLFFTLPFSIPRVNMVLIILPGLFPPVLRNELETICSPWPYGGTKFKHRVSVGGTNVSVPNHCVLVNLSAAWERYGFSEGTTQSSINSCHGGFSRAKSI